MEQISYKLEVFEGPMDLLLHLISVSLLPVYEEAEDLKKELTGELLEYRDCQLMAGKLAQRTEGFDRFVRNPIQIDIDPTYTRLHEPTELLRAYLNVVGKKMRKLPPPIEAFKGIVATKTRQAGRKAPFSCFICRCAVPFGYGCDFFGCFGACQNKKTVFGRRGRCDARGIARRGF